MPDLFLFQLAALAVVGCMFCHLFVQATRR